MDYDGERTNSKLRVLGNREKEKTGIQKYH